MQGGKGNRGNREKREIVKAGPVGPAGLAGLALSKPIITRNSYYIITIYLHLSIDTTTIYNHHLSIYLPTCIDCPSLSMPRRLGVALYGLFGSRVVCKRR